MRKINTSEASVLSYWRAIEMFTPQSVPKLDRHNSVRQIFDAEDGLPWGPNGRRPRIPVGRDKVLRHTIYIGVYSIQDAYGVLDKIFEPDREWRVHGR